MWSPAVAGTSVVPSPSGSPGPVPGLFAAKNARSAPSLLINASSITITRITAGGDVAILGVLLHRRERIWTDVVQLEQILIDDDLDGRVELTFDEDIPRTAAFAAVDLTTGAGVVNVPEGFRLREIPPSQRQFRSVPSPVLELGRMLGRPMPYTSAVYACTKLLGVTTIEGARG